MCKTIHQKVKFKAAPDVVYRLLATAKLHQQITGQKAAISPKVGGSFAVLAGAVRGINVDLVPGTRIVQAWRRGDFPPGVFSMAAVTLSKAPDGGTELRLVHRGVPKELIPDVEECWRSSYWMPIKAYLEKHAPRGRSLKPS